MDWKCDAQVWRATTPELTFRVFRTDWALDDSWIVEWGCKGRWERHCYFATREEAIALAEERTRKKRPGQREDETPMEYLRRVVNNGKYETESLWDQMPSVEACLEFFELWAVSYGTDFWAGVLECIEQGDSPDAARAFVKKWNLGAAWMEDINDAVARATEDKEANQEDPACKPTEEVPSDSEGQSV